MPLSLSDIASKLGFHSKSFKQLVLSANDGEGHAFDISQSGRLINGKLPYWNIWSNVSPARWALTSNTIQCNCDSVVKWSELGASHDMSANPPHLELPTKLFSVTDRFSFSGTYYGSKWDIPQSLGLGHFRVDLGDIKLSSDPIPIVGDNESAEYSTSIYKVGGGVATFHLYYQYGEEVMQGYELEPLQKNVILSKLSVRKDVTSIIEILYNASFTHIVGFSGDLIIANSVELNTVSYRFTYGEYESGVLVARGGLSAPLQSHTFQAGQVEQYAPIQYMLPIPIAITDIPLTYNVFCDILSATSSWTDSFAEIPASIDRE